MARQPSYLRPLATILVCVCFANAGLPGIPSADTIHVVADLWCPYNCEPVSPKPGFMVEMARLILGAAGHEVIYEAVPWKRALEGTHSGTYQAVIAGTPENTKPFDPPFVFPANEQGRMHNCFFVLQDTEWAYAGVDSLDGQRLGIVQGYGYPAIQPHVDAHLGTVAVQAFAGDSAVERNIRKLLAGRLTVILEDEAVFRYAARRMGVAGKFRIAGDDGTPPQVNNLYLAFTPQEHNPKSKYYARIMSDGMIAIRKNGTLEALLQKYGLNDWR